jgi:hypothetical protein
MKTLSEHAQRVAPSIRSRIHAEFDIASATPNTPEL